MTKKKKKAPAANKPTSAVVPPKTAFWTGKRFHGKLTADEDILDLGDASGIKLVRTRSVRLALAFAEAIMAKDSLPEDRDVLGDHVDKISIEMRQHDFRYEIVTVATALCAETGQNYRVNGRHVCETVIALHAVKPEFTHGRVKFAEYTCRTYDDVRRLFNTFDTNAGRKKDVGVRIALAGTPEFATVPKRVIRNLQAGAMCWLWANGRERAKHDANDVAHLLRYAHVDPATRVAGFATGSGGFKQKTHAHMQRGPVFGAMLATFKVGSGPGLAFWTAVRDGAELSPGDPRLVLREWLKDSKMAVVESAPTRDKNVVSAEAMYRCCIRAWNTWRQGGKLKGLCGRTDGCRPEAL